MLFANFAILFEQSLNQGKSITYKLKTVTWTVKALLLCMQCNAMPTVIDSLVPSPCVILTTVNNCIEYRCTYFSMRNLVYYISMKDLTFAFKRFEIWAKMGIWNFRFD